LFFETAPNLPNYLIGDKVRLYQILINLLSNAIKFTQQGSIKLNITPLEKQLNTTDYWIKFSVEDTGIGIDPTEIASIFEDFKQINSNKDHQGLGLGLSIVKQLVALMKGTIEVSSQLYSGSCFSVSLPFAIATNEDMAQEQALQQQKEISHQWKTKQALLIEDNPVNRLYAESLLTQWNLVNTKAETIREAKEKVKEQKYDCIFVDIGLPDGNGFDFIKWLQSSQGINQKTPIIVLSATMFEEHQKLASGLQIKAYLTKPFSPQQLFAEITKLFGSTVSFSPLLPPNSLLSNQVPATTDYLAHLRKLLKGNAKNMQAIITIALEQIQEFIDNTNQSLPNNNWEMVFNDAHRLKSTLGTLGIEKLKEPIIAIEKLTHSRQNLDEIASIFEDFKQQCQTEIPKLEAELRQL
jgi:hypothetical protein